LPERKSAEASAGKGPISLDDARRLCAEIRKERGVRLFSQCWGCVKFSKGSEEKMCYYKPPDFRGCELVNKRYAEGRTGR
jgi:hypothetical protein